MITFIYLFTFLVIILGSASHSKVCNWQESVELTNGTYNGIVFKDSEIIRNIYHGREIVKGCVCLKGICARKCCQFGSAYDSEEKKCVSFPNKFNPPVWTQENVLLEKFNATKEFIFIFGKVVCAKDKGESRLPVFPAATNFHLLQNGKLFVEIPEHNPSVFIYKPHKYCIDIFVSRTERPHLNALTCYVTAHKYKNLELSSICRLFSCFYILLTVLVFAWLPELRNLNGMLLIAVLLSFCMSSLFLSTKQILVLRKGITLESCFILSFITYFFQLSTILWVNVMCYDIWCSFSGKRMHAWSETQHMRFLYYALYAFGVPAAVTAVLVGLGFSNIPIQNTLLPKIKSNSCFFNGINILLYLYGPTLLLSLVDITFLVLTGFNIAKIKRKAKDTESSLSDQDRKDIRRFVLYVKLIVIQCIYWSLNGLAALFPEGDFIWQFSDACDLVVGLAIFITVVCKNNTWKLIKKRYNLLKDDPMSRSTITISSSTVTQSVALDDLQMNSYKKLYNF